MIKANKTDVLGGALVVALGAYFAYGALDYRLGTVVRMGPGYLPFALGIIAILLGAAIILTALGNEGEIEPFKARMVLPVLGSILAFALILPRAGLIPATIVAVCLASLSSPRSRPQVTLLSSVVVAFLVWVAFILLLGMPIPVLRNPF